jgi:hypothetical protein
MKKLWILAVLLPSILLAVSCEKENANTNETQIISNGNEMSNSNIISEGKYKREIVVSDKDNNNRVFYAIYSDDEQLLQDFVDNSEFLLTVENTTI